MKSASKNPILIIDRAGLIGDVLCQKLSQEFQVVFVSRRNSSSDKEIDNIIRIPFLRKNPTIPDNKYSHIIFIDEEVEDLELLPKTIDKVRGVNAEFIFAFGLLAGKENVVDKVLRLCPSAKIAIFGDIFDNRLVLKRENFKSVINKYIYQAQKFGKMQILGEGLREAYPVFLPDVIEGLINLAFRIRRPHSLFYIFPKHPPSELSLAHMIQKINPEITIDFVRRDPRLKNISYPEGGEYLLIDKYPIAQKIRSIDIKKKPLPDGGMRGKFLNGNMKKIKSFPLLAAWILIFLFISPFIFTNLFSFVGLNTLYYAKKAVDKGNFANAKSSLHLSETFFYLGEQTASILLFQAKALGLENKLTGLLRDTKSGYKISQSLSQIFNSGTYFSKILNGKSEDPLSDFVKGESYLKSSIVELNKLKAEERISTSISQNLEIINPLIKLLSATSDMMPSIFGMEGPKTYLILLQNNLELRPGGGLIESYGILKFNMGKITEFSIHDTYDADVQLRGHVEPPFALRRYLPSQHWYMRDSSFDVDFVNSAPSSSNFLLAETGRKTDGVIAVDSSFIKRILRAVGPVYVTDYKETVDENNFHALMYSHFDKNFLRSLSKAIITKISEGKTSYLLIAQAMSDTLAQKHLLFYLKDWQNVFIVNGWSSSLWDERKESEKTVNDFMGISEANLGMNKVNGFIERQVAQSVKIESDGSLFGELNLDYKNTSTSWPGGNYKNYLRIILPFNASISSILINDIQQSIVDAVTNPQVYEAKKFKAPTGLEVERLIEKEKAIYGFLVNVPIGEIVKIKIRYSVQRENAFDSGNFSYNLKIFKQPGIDKLSYSFSLYYPDNLNVTNVSNFKKEDNSLSYSGNVIEDGELKAEFVAK